MKRFDMTVIGVYYGYLLPILCFVTAVLFMLKPGEPGPGWDALLLLVPGLAWVPILDSLLGISKEPMPMVVPLLMFWSLAGILIYGAFIGVMHFLEKEKVRKAAEANHRDAQQGYRKQMIVLGERAINIFESMPEYLCSAEKYLDQAEADFADGAFAPFWDSIEEAVKTLGRFDEGIRQIKDNSSLYSELIKKYDDTPPQFPLARQSVERLRVSSATAKRMQAIVRQAQRNFQFATIYEQRKTNQILVTGFTNLANALNNMTWQITDSINNLASSVAGITSTFNKSIQAIHSRMGDIAETTIQHHEELMKEASERTEREKKALEMLDNIQRRRKPSLWEGPRP